MKISNHVLISVDASDVKKGSVKIPKNVTHIGDGAFGGCTGLTAVTFQRFKKDIKYTNLQHADGYIVFVEQQRNYNANTEIYKGKLFLGMRDKDVLCKECYVAESCGEYAHGSTLKNAMADLNFKQAKARGAEQYKDIGIDEAIRFEDAVNMYRIITGACQFGTEAFIDHLPEIKDAYTPREIIDMTAGQYGHREFKDFFRR